jgi:hypothetical protein
MLALHVAISSADLSERVRFRLGGAVGTPSVVWQRGGQHVLLHLDSLRLRILDGWLLCNLDLEADATRRQTLQFIFFLGTGTDSRGLNASGTINAPTVPSAQLADLWGADAQRLIWDAVLDGLEAALALARKQRPNDPITLEGFVSVTDALQVHLLAGVS